MYFLKMIFNFQRLELKNTLEMLGCIMQNVSNELKNERYTDLKFFRKHIVINMLGIRASTNKNRVPALKNRVLALLKNFLSFRFHNKQSRVATLFHKSNDKCFESTCVIHISLQKHFQHVTNIV